VAASRIGLMRGALSPARSWRCSSSVVSGRIISDRLFLIGGLATCNAKEWVDVIEMSWSLEYY
jgi:hypothetical protein